MFNLELTPKQLSRATNKTKNLRIISGSLVLIAIQESLANHNFTSTTVITWDSFNLTSSNLIFEVRASFPFAKGVYGVVFLIPEKDVDDYALKEAFVLLINNVKTIKAGYLRIGEHNYHKSFDISPESTNFENFYLQFQNENTFQPRLTWSIDGNFLHTVIFKKDLVLI